MDLSIIIPSYNERDNVRAIVGRIHGCMKPLGIAYEIWFVDDSTDDTVDELVQLEQEDQSVHVHHRTEERGLASAVVRGFSLSTGRYVIVMDADLQHPPEMLPEMYMQLQTADVVIPSRFIEGGSDGGLNPIRKFISWAARKIGQVMLRRLRRITDCTSGFFGLKRTVIQRADLDPIGWKILIEVLIKGQYQTVHEIPYSFMARDAGESKMNLQEQLNYVRHMVRLVSQSPEDRQFLLFCTIGASGVVVNMLVLAILKYWGGFSDTPASIVASLVAMLSNYIWNDQITWRRVDGRKWSVKLPLFIGISVVGIGITTLVMNLLKTVSIPVWLGQVVGILVSTLWSYAMNNRLTWREKVKVDEIVVTKETKPRSIQP